MQIDGCTILLQSGRYVNPLDLQPDDVAIDDIVHALSNQCRFSGHTRTFYSVAEHSVRVAYLLRDAGHPMNVVLWGLLHDAAEAYLVDLPRPLKHHPGFGDTYRAVEAHALSAITRRFGLVPDEPAAVKHADLRLLATERRDLLPPIGNWAILDGVQPLDEQISPWRPDTAATFMFRLYREVARVPEAA